jgi:hypothetical protein
LLDIFLQNLFRVRGSLTVFNTPIDLGNVRCDKYVVAGLSDHITPWRGVYRAAKLFGGATEFVLSEWTLRRGAAAVLRSVELLQEQGGGANLQPGNQHRDGCEVHAGQRKARRRNQVGREGMLRA